MSLRFKDAGGGGGVGVDGEQGRQHDDEGGKRWV
jgi:hypothetical protein